MSSTTSLRFAEPPCTRAGARCGDCRGRGSRGRHGVRGNQGGCAGAGRHLAWWSPKRQTDADDDPLVARFGQAASDPANDPLVIRYGTATRSMPQTPHFRPLVQGARAKPGNSRRCHLGGQAPENSRTRRRPSSGGGDCDRYRVLASSLEGGHAATSDWRSPCGDVVDSRGRDCEPGRSVVAQPAQAEGFNFLCGGSGGGGGDSEFSLLATGLATKIISDQALWFATITVPAGVPVTASGAVTDPVTHATTFTMLIAPELGN